MQKIDRKQWVYWRATESNFQENITTFRVFCVRWRKTWNIHILLCYSTSWTYKAVGLQVNKFSSSGFIHFKCVEFNFPCACNIGWSAAKQNEMIRVRVHFELDSLEKFSRITHFSCSEFPFEPLIDVQKTFCSQNIIF